MVYFQYNKKQMQSIRMIFYGGTVINVGEKGIDRITHRTLSYGFSMDIVDIAC